MSAADFGWLAGAPLDALLPRARALTREGFGELVTYSRKVFVPLTHLCRDVCHYCTFATAPRRQAAPYLGLEQVLEIARAGQRAGCKEALFTLGDAPEKRYRVAARWLADHGYASTLDYLEAAARAVFEETGLLPHLNPGVMDSAALARLRPVAVSMGLMLESAAGRLCEPGGPHHGSPDKRPAVRLQVLRDSGALAIPMTTGLLVGIGDTRAERIEALCAIGEIHAAYGHIQEVIVQNFAPKPATRMAAAPAAPLDEQLWTIAAARIILGPGMAIQAPPNLRADDPGRLIAAGINDWGGVSPVTPDHVNPEAPWPSLAALERATIAAGARLGERLAIGPAYARDPARWAAPKLATAIRRAAQADGLARDAGWCAGRADPAPPAFLIAKGDAVGAAIPRIVDRARAGLALAEAEIARLFAARDAELAAVIAAADALRRDQAGEAVTHVVNRNINYTNICLYSCGFCAFSKGSAKAARGPAYRIDLDEIAARAVEAEARGATEVCLQGGIHPAYDGNTYLGIVAAVKEAAPALHVHAFSPLEISHGAETLGLDLETFLARLRDAGLASLPGTAAEILDDAVRAIICPDKLDTQGWIAVMRAAHRVGLRSTATIMFGHVESPRHWARHLVLLDRLQRETGVFTEFVPLPFVHMEAPMWRRGEARSGPTLREALLMHAVGRIALGASFANVQTSWVKMGPEAAALALRAGANDLGGVLMDESITRAAGGRNGQRLDTSALAEIAAAAGRPLAQRSTLYRPAARPVPA